jgi:hypothetical protein
MASRLKRRIPVIFGGVGGATGSSTMAAIGRMLRWGVGAATGSATTAYVGSSSGSSGGFTAETDFSAPPSTSYVNGATVTITDTQSRFGTKPNGAKPVTYYDFSAGTLTPNTTHSRTATAYAFSTGNEISTAVVPTNGTYCVRMDVATAPSTSSHGPRAMHVGPDRWYVFRKRYTAFNIVTDKKPPDGTFANGTFNWKTQRLWVTAGSSGYPSLYVGYQGAEGLGSGRMPYETLNENPTGDSRAFGSPPQRPNVWETVEWFGEPSTINLFDARMNYIVNGEAAVAPAARWRTRTTALPDTAQYLFFDQVSNGTDAGPNYVYSTDIYVDDSWCRVLVSDEATWVDSDSGSADREIQLPTAWAGNSITFTMRFGELSSLAGKYLWVVTSDGTALKIGRFT